MTTETTVPKFSVSTVQSTGFSTVTTTQFATSSLAKAKALLVYHENIRAPGEEYGCTFAHKPFNAQAGDVVKGTVTADNEINFYIMTQKDYDEWNSKGTCGVHVTTIVEETIVGTYEIQFVIPANGKYQLLILNFSHENDVKVDLTANIVGIAKESSVVLTRTYTQQSYSTQTGVVSTIVTRTATSLHTEQVGQPGLSMEVPSLLLMVVGIVVGIGVVVGAFVLRSRRGKPKTETKLYEPVVEEKTAPEPVVPPRPSRAPPPGMKFCVHCGTAIPKNARFCTKIDCGKPQD